MSCSGSRIAVALMLAGAATLYGQQNAQSSLASEVSSLFQAKCLQCHGDAQQMAGLDLRTRESLLKGGLSGPAVVPGNPDASALYLRLTGAKQPAMPFGSTLAADKIDTVRKWIEAGAPWQSGKASPAAAKTQPAKHEITEADRQWWAFQKPVRYSVPDVADGRWNKNPIDAFLEAKREEKGLAPAPRADKRTLIRRAYLDLLGLLPSPEEVEAFAADDSPRAFANLVDKLLESPHYGERWARHWLDVARYADSKGYEQDFNNPGAWRYRDYVIRAFNEDKPYNRFVIEQLAGDELDDSDFDSVTALGFHRVGPRVAFREKDNPEYRYTYLDDMIGTTSRAFMALTVNCARCHDHKFDPILQKDYYRMMAVFFPYVDYDFPLAPPDVVSKYEAKVAAVDAEIEPLKERLDAVEAPYREQAFENRLKKFPEDIQIAVHTPEEQRTEGQKLLAAQVRSIGAGRGYRSLMSKEDSAVADQLRSDIKKLEKQKPAPLPTAVGIRDGDYRFTPDGPGDSDAPGKGRPADADFDGSYLPVAGKPYVAPELHFQSKGNTVGKGPEILPGFPEVLVRGDPPTAIKPADGRPTTGRRRAFAEWLASPDHPLTARVMVNRIWQHHFGSGIVDTPSNFGRMGHRPTHPKLLDWLATEFVRGGWSVKAMHRLIMNSESYQMASSFISEPNVKADPRNKLLYKFPQQRLEGEIIRDIILSSAGNLDLSIGGKPYFPAVEESVRKAVAKGIWEVKEDGPELWRRGVYSYYKRGMPYPMFDVFDQPDPNVTCERRDTTTVPTQALTLLNNEFVLKQAGYFAGRVEQAAGPEQDAQVREAYRIALGRDPTAEETNLNVSFLNQQLALHRKEGAADPRQAALADLCDVVLNLNEFVYIN